jgi:hypothetical protein
MTVKTYAFAVLATAFLGAGMVAPAYAATTQATTENISDYTDLSGPGGTFGIAQSGKAAAEGYRGFTPTDGAAAASETLLTSVAASPEDASKTYVLSLPASATAEVSITDAGEESVVLLNSAGELLGGIASEDVVDANGVPVPTSFDVDGTTVTQTLDPQDGDDVAFPVQMSARAGTVWYSAAWVTTNSKGYIVNAEPTALGRQQIAWTTHATHVKHLKSVLGSQAYRVNYNIEQQFVCHVVGAWFPTGTYNMESWQPSLQWGVIANPIDRCNRIK